MGKSISHGSKVHNGHLLRHRRHWDQNAFIESFHTLAEARAHGYAWMHGYNTTHAHSALDYRTPDGCLATYETINLPQKSVAA